jgi:ribosomal protein S18 acetylase RimI-like enzyme
MNTVSYRDADEGDADQLAALFSDTFTETFQHLYEAADLDAFLEQHTAARWAEQLRDQAFAVRIAEIGRQAVGLAKIGPVKLPVDEADGALELRQLYVRRAVRGSGVAAELMDWTMEQARIRDATALYLSVYTENLRAQRFYARHGFEIIGPCVFMVGSQVDEDVIMRKTIKPGLALLDS